MNKIYLKAVVFSLVFSLAGFFIINLIDSQTILRLEDRVNESALEAQESKLFFLLLNDAQNKEVACSLIKQKIDLQFGRNAAFLSAIDEANKSIFLKDFSLVKKNYFLANAELYFLFKQANEVCNEENELILFFYKDQKPLCADCLVQGKILDEIRASCPNVKSFAFPVDLEIGVVDLFKSLHSFDGVPSIVINEQIVFEGLASKEKIMAEISCRA